MSLTKNFKLSIIIPVFNEEDQINSLLEFFAAYPDIECIFVDGGSTDKTLSILKKKKANYIITSKGRAKQMNQGANIATGNILLFLHADTKLPEQFPILIQKTIQKKKFIAGAFLLGIEDDHIVYRWIETLIKIRCILFKLPYGDQAIFLTKETFIQQQGFPEVPIMEDFIFMKQLNKKGKIYIQKNKIYTSPRRWKKLGIIKTTLLNQIIILGYYVGVPLKKLASLYTQQK